jgi:hypothetical protein
MNKITSIIGLFVGTILLSIGIFMKVSNIVSDGYTTGRYGSIHYGTVDGYGVIILGIVILLLSILTYPNLNNDENRKKNIEKEFKDEPKSKTKKKRKLRKTN